MSTLWHCSTLTRYFLAGVIGYAVGLLATFVHGTELDWFGQGHWFGKRSHCLAGTVQCVHHNDTDTLLYFCSQVMVTPSVFKSQGRCT